MENHQAGAQRRQRLNAVTMARKVSFHLIKIKKLIKVGGCLFKHSSELVLRY